MGIIYQDKGVIYSLGRAYSVEFYLYDDRIVIDKNMKLTGGGFGLAGIAARALYKARGKGKETIVLSYNDVFYAKEARSGLRKVVKLKFKNPNTGDVEEWTIFNLKNRSKFVSSIQQKL